MAVWLCYNTTNKMKIEIKKFGTMLISRPAGKEAFAAAKAYVFPPNFTDKVIILDFTGVEVLSPSWADEFISGIKGSYKDCRLEFINTQNQSVKETLDILSALSP